MTNGNKSFSMNERARVFYETVRVCRDALKNAPRPAGGRAGWADSVSAKSPPSAVNAHPHPSPALRARINYCIYHAPRLLFIRLFIYLFIFTGIRFRRSRTYINIRVRVTWTGGHARARSDLKYFVLNLGVVRREGTRGGNVKPRGRFTIFHRPVSLLYFTYRVFHLYK